MLNLRYLCLLLFLPSYLCCMQTLPTLEELMYKRLQEMGYEPKYTHLACKPVFYRLHIALPNHTSYAFVDPYNLAASSLVYIFTCNFCNKICENSQILIDHYNQEHAPKA